VIVPTYNRASTIATTLRSLHDQEFGDFEVIVVDDGSTDDTEEVVKRAEVDRVTYRWQPNSGPSVARNLGAELATGDYLVFLDTADRAHPDWLAGFDELIRTHGARLVSCGVDFTRDGEVVNTRSPRRLGPGAAHVTALFRTGCFAVDRALFAEVGGFDPELWFSEASELGMRFGRTLVARGEDPAHTPRSLLSIELPPDAGPGGRSSSLAYSDERRLRTAEHILAKHHDVMASAPKLRQTYLRIAGVASARLGRSSDARRYFLRAWKARPTDVRELLRAGATIVPPVRTRLWPPKA
jgi:glycosyltransferase involved in cell wall biosynthesis